MIGRGNGKKTPGLVPWGISRRQYWNEVKKRIRADARQSEEARQKRLERNQKISNTKRKKKPPSKTCIREHTWTRENTRIEKNRRHCRACESIRTALRAEIKKWLRRLHKVHPDVNSRSGVRTRSGRDRYHKFRRYVKRYKKAQKMFDEWRKRGGK